MTVVGTMLLCFGMGLCAALIERTTKEHVFRRLCFDNVNSSTESVRTRPGNPRTSDQNLEVFASPNDTRMYWVQPGPQSIGDQIFDPFAYSDNRFPLRRYITSWKNTNRDSSSMKWIWTASITTLTGFIFQFLGLRACHSSVAVAQFAVTILMSIVRASLRTERLRTDDNLLRNDPDCFQGNELDFLALNIAQSTTSRPKKSEEDELGPVWWIISASRLGDFNTSATASPDVAAAASNPHTNRSTRFSVLERLPSVSESRVALCGFRIKEDPVMSTPRRRREDFLTHTADSELFLWKWSEYCTKHETECSPGQTCKHDFNAAIKALFYRARLARLTGLEQPKSEHSSYWGERFVPAREIATALALAIDDTLEILFDSSSTDPVRLLQPWQQAFSIFWTLQCSVHDRPQAPGRYGDIHMSLRREIDESGVPKGPWKADRSEIEAVLGLWSWSFKSLHIGGMPRTEEHGIRRILSAHRDMEYARRESLHLNIWREAKGDSEIREQLLNVDISEVDATQHGGGFFVKSRRNHQEKKPTLRCIQNQNAYAWLNSSQEGAHRFELKAIPVYGRSFVSRLVLGWCNVIAEEVSPENKVAVLVIVSKDSIVVNCAQEIYSIFLAAISQIVEHIGKTSAVERHGTLTGTASNGNIKRIQKALIARGLCDEKAAFACTIPVLKRQGKLKLPDEILEMARGLADKYQSEKKLKELNELLDWMHHHSLAKFATSYTDENPAEKMDATNSVRLSVLQLCETYQTALVQDDDEESAFGYQGILGLLHRLSKDEVYKNMPLVWTDYGQASSISESESRSFTIAETIRCYGEAAWWHLQLEVCLLTSLNYPSVDYQRHQFEEEFHTFFPGQQRSVPDYFSQAIENVDLSSTLYLLKKNPPSDLVKFQLLIRASQVGWFIVIQALNPPVEIINQEDQDRRTALSYASELGDINAVRTLIRAGATLRPDGDRRRQMFPIHYAAKGGHAVIITDLLDKWSDSHHEDDQGMTPLNWTITSGNVEALRAFLKSEVYSWTAFYDSLDRRPPLHWAIQEGKADMVGALLEIEGVDPNFTNHENIRTPPLTCALRLRNEEIFQRILESERVSPHLTDQDGRSTVWWAAALGLDSYVKRLLDSGKYNNLEGSDSRNETPLSIAVRAGHLEVVRLLSARIGPEARLNLEAILMAAKKGHHAVVQELLPYKVRNKGQARLILEELNLSGVWHSIQDSDRWAQSPEKSLDTETEIDEGAVLAMDLLPRKMELWHRLTMDFDSFTIF